MARRVQSASPLELLREAVPGITRVALLLYALDPLNARRMTPVETAARTLGVHLHLVEVDAPNAFEAAFSAMTRQGVDGLLVSFTPFLGAHRSQIADLAAKSRLPAIDSNRSFAEQGGLLSSGVMQADLWRRVASYVDRILQILLPPTREAGQLRNPVVGHLGHPLHPWGMTPTVSPT